MKDERKIDSSKGVTLTVLVITIIVLVILAGIAISYLIGDNGIVRKAQLSKEETKSAQVEEENSLEEYEREIRKYSEDDGETVSKKEYQVLFFL